MTPNWLEDAQVYGAKWEVTSEMEIPAEVVKQIDSVRVIMSPGRHDEEFDFDGSLQMEVTLKKGGVVYWGLSTESDLEEGDKVDVDSIKQLTLSRPGDDDIFRYDGEALEETPKKRK